MDEQLRGFVNVVHHGQFGRKMPGLASLGMYVFEQIYIFHRESGFRESFFVFARRLSSFSCP